MILEGEEPPPPRGAIGYPDNPSSARTAAGSPRLSSAGGTISEEETRRSYAPPETIFEEETPRSYSGYSIKTRKYNRQRRLDTHRFFFAGWLLLLVTIMVVMAIVASFAKADIWGQMKDFISLVFVPVLTLTGSAVGFYYADKR